MHKHIHSGKLFLLFTLVATLLSACSGSNDAVEDINGKTYTLSQPGSWIFINYWAIWCKPCRKEVPDLNQFAAANRQQVVLWAVNFDGVQGDQLRDEAEQLGIEFPVLTSDPGSHWNVAKPKVLPTTLVVRPDGSLHSVLYGPQSLESLNRLITNATQQVAPLATNETPGSNKPARNDEPATSE